MSPSSVDRRGQVVDHDQIASLREECWNDEAKRPMIGAADFREAVFRGVADFNGFHFGAARFHGATFEAEADFTGAEFVELASFESVHFQHAVSFERAVFQCEAIFAYDDSRKRQAVAGRKRMSVTGRREVIFGGWADFRGARFPGGGRFGGADFESRARFDGAEFGAAGASFEGARFPRARTFGPILVLRGTLSLDRATFEGPGSRITVTAREVSCRGASFLARTTIRVNNADVYLDDAEFGQPAIIEDGALGGEKSRICSLHRANVANLTLVGCDLRECRFVGAHNLEGLRFEDAELGRTRRPSTARRVIAEESEGNIPAALLAPTYRALRKGREDSKDEPGAADFYYGEMEARRKSATGFDKALLTAYWIVSGYGLRAWRSIACLALTVALFGWGFEAGGFDPDQDLGSSVLFAAESTTSLFRAPDPPGTSALTDIGRVLQMALRLLGPLFFGLALLALRGRVKR